LIGARVRDPEPGAGGLAGGHSRDEMLGRARAVDLHVVRLVPGAIARRPLRRRGRRGGWGGRRRWGRRVRAPAKAVPVAVTHSSVRARKKVEIAITFGIRAIWRITCTCKTIVLGSASERESASSIGALSQGCDVVVAIR